MLNTDSINSYNMQVPGGKGEKDRAGDRVTTAVEQAGTLQAKGTQPCGSPSGWVAFASLWTVLKNGQESANKNQLRVPRECLCRVLSAQ